MDVKFICGVLWNTSLFQCYFVERMDLAFLVLNIKKKCNDMSQIEETLQQNKSDFKFHLSKSHVSPSLTFSSFQSNP